MNWIERLRELGACGTALDWCETQPSPEVAWSTCQRGDRLLWVVARVGDFRAAVRAACACARLALHHVPAEECLTVSRRAIEAAEAWTRGETTREEVRAAYVAAYAAADDAAPDAAAYAAYAAAYAAYTAAYVVATATADAAAAAAYAAADAARAAAAADARASIASVEDARTAAFARCANIVREMCVMPVDF
jgi:hypothetical protein